jgi:hypothetical protein
MAQWNQVTRFLCCHDPGDARRCENISLGDFVLLDGSEGGRLQMNLAPRDGLAG